MKKIILLLCYCGFVAACFAQEIPRELLQDSVIGWMKVYNLKGTKEPVKTLFN